MRKFYRQFAPLIALLTFSAALVPGASTIKSSFGSSNQTITITLASLSASATVCRQSTAIDNSSNLFLDILVSGLVETGTVSGNTQVVFYAAGTADGGTTYGGKNGTNAIGASDASFTRANPTDLKQIGTLPTPTNSLVYSYGPYSVAAAFNGVLPDHVVIIACNDTGAALSATAGNNKMFYQGILAQITTP